MAVVLFPNRKAELERGLREEIKHPTALSCEIDARVYLAFIQAEKGNVQDSLQAFDQLQNETIPDAYLLRW